MEDVTKSEKNTPHLSALVSILTFLHVLEPKLKTKLNKNYTTFQNMGTDVEKLVFYLKLQCVFFFKLQIL